MTAVLVVGAPHVSHSDGMAVSGGRNQGGEGRGSPCQVGSWDLASQALFPQAHQAAPASSAAATEGALRDQLVGLCSHASWGPAALQGSPPAPETWRSTLTAMNVKNSVAHSREHTWSCAHMHAHNTRGVIELCSGYYTLCKIITVKDILPLVPLRSSPTSNILIPSSWPLSEAALAWPPLS